MSDCCEHKGLVESLLPGIDSILGVRDSIGAIVYPVYFVTRTWSGCAVGEGTAVDQKVQMLPTPALQWFAQDLRLKEGGMIKAGDIKLKSVSRNKFKESDLDGSSISDSVERFYLVGPKLYQVINLVEKYVTFDVLLRELTDQARYGI